MGFCKRQTLLCFKKHFKQENFKFTLFRWLAGRQIFLPAKVASQSSQPSPSQVPAKVAGQSSQPNNQPNKIIIRAKLYGAKHMGQLGQACRAAKSLDDKSPRRTRAVLGNALGNALGNSPQSNGALKCLVCLPLASFKKK